MNKETDYKQKYEDVVGFIRDLYPHASDYVKEKLSGYFPELSDMDDECLKRSLIQYLDEQRVVKDNPTTCHPYRKWIEWVNKHGGNEDTPKWVIDYIRNVDESIIGQFDGKTNMSLRMKLRAVLEYVAQHPKYGNETDGWNDDDLKMLDRIRVDLVDFKNIVEDTDGTDVDAINEEIEWLNQTIKKHFEP